MSFLNISSIGVHIEVTWTMEIHTNTTYTDTSLDCKPCGSSVIIVYICLSVYLFWWIVLFSFFSVGQIEFFFNLALFCRRKLSTWLIKNSSQIVPWKYLKEVISISQHIHLLIQMDFHMLDRLPLYFSPFDIYIIIPLLFMLTNILLISDGTANWTIL